MNHKALHKIDILQVQLNSAMQELSALRKELLDSGVSKRSSRKGLSAEQIAELDFKFNKSRTKKAER